MVENSMLLYANLTKADHDQHIVEGYISTDSIDRDNQVMDASFLQRTIPSWIQRYGNVRLMHRPEPIGKIVSWKPWDGKGFYVTAKITDAKAWKMVKDGLLNAFSIGIKNAKVVPDPEAKGGRVVDGEPIEVSLVDVPSNPDCDLVVVKGVFDINTQEWRVDDIEKTMDDIDLTCLMDGLSDDEVDAYKRYYSAKERREMPESDFAGPHRSFPIKTQEDVDNAARLIGHAKDPEAVKRRIIEIARRKGFKIPESWQKEQDTKKDITLDSGLQAPNLEGQDERNEKTTVAEEQVINQPVEPDNAKSVSDADNAVQSESVEKEATITPQRDEQMFNLLQDIKSLIESLANQTAHDRDGDIDFAEHNAHESEEEVKRADDFDPDNIKKSSSADDSEDVEDEDGEDEEDKAAKKGDVQKSSVANEVDLVDSIVELVKSIVAEEFTRLKAEHENVQKTVVADEAKSLVADIEKRYDELHKTVSDVAERLAVVEQMAAPPKGSVMAIEREIKKSSQADLLDTVRKFAAQLPEDGQRELFTNIYKTQFNGGN
jgi:hypothetical protein